MGIGKFQEEGFVRKTKLLALAAAVVLAAFAVVAAVTGSSSAAPAQATNRLAVVTDIGGLNDRSFNQSANRGRLIAQRTLRFQTRVYDTRTASDRLPNLRAAAEAGHGLIFATGFLLFDAAGKVAPSYPNTKFAGIDIPIAVVEGRPRNFRGLIFQEHEAGYLVGYIAGLVVKAQAGPDIVSAVGANPVPAIIRYIAGYRAGVRKANARATVLVNYANDPTFSDQAKCKESALNQLARRSQIVFQVAGGCGLGALSAAKERGRWGIGVDVNQSFLGRHILTSALKEIVNAVVATAREYKANPRGFRTGFDKIFSVKNNGVGYSPISARLPKALRTQITTKVNAIKRQIASGRIKPPTK
jgi:basic membrane protein A